MSVRRWLSLIVLIAILGRIAFIVLFDHTLSLQTSGYDTYAVNVMEGHGYTRYEDRDADSDLPPLYPFFLVGVYKLLGRDPIPVALVQIGLDVLVILLLFWIGRRVAGDVTGLLAAAFYGFYPYLLYQNLTLNDTGIFILLLVAGIAAAYKAHDVQDSRYDWRWAVALGICFGLGALTKSLIILLLPMLALWWWVEIGFRATLRLSLVSGIALAAVMAPWIIRNTRLHGELVLLSTNGGSNLHQGNNSCVADYLARGWDAQWVNCLAIVPDDLSEPAADRWHREQAIDYLRENPGAWPRLFWTKFWVLWSPAIMPYDLPPDPYLIDDAVLQYNSTAFQAARVIHILYFGPLLLLGILGLTLAWRDKLKIGPLVAVIVAITITYMLFHPSTRYRSPADPFVFVLAGYAVTRAWAWIVPRLPEKYRWGAQATT
ncbi:MAG: glycosyltransferase family 39 protein [Anaerolineae bacterium]|nr:glycosyltransferase family 39 protein [Anaerolineae bacterium]